MLKSYSKLKILAIIPARGGSKGVPRKNIHSLCGKPLIVWTIQAALRSEFINSLVVSTDDQEIAEVARAYGAEVVIRPAEISGDEAPSEAALLHTLEHLERHEGYTPDILVFLQCTSPLTLPEDIDGTIRTLLTEEADSALTVTPCHYFLWRSDDKGNAIGINHDKGLRPLRQQRQSQYLETGAVYAMHVEDFKRLKHRFFGKTVIYLMPPERSHEIDEPLDFQITELLLRERLQKEKLDMLPDTVSAFVLDFDGVLTDNRVLVFQDGLEAVLCNRSDGLGLSRLHRLGVPILVLSTEENPVVAARCRKLGLTCMHGLKSKAEALQKYLVLHSLNPKQSVYLANDINDLECMRLVGCALAVADAHPAVLAEATLILENSGGFGAVRELCDLILTRLGQHRPVERDDLWKST